jgi:hypothetical protein
MYERFIVLGDSFSEGLCDEFYPETHRYRGWADRLADVLAEQNETFTYVNHAIRGKLLNQVLELQVVSALTQIIPRKTLVSFHAGANDLLRPKYDGLLIAERYANAVAQLTQAGAQVMLFTVIERAGGSGRTADRLAARFASFNVHVREAARVNNAIVIDAAEAHVLQDRRFWDADRLHLNPEGHRRVAEAISVNLGLSTDRSWREPLPAEQPSNQLANLWEDLRWIQAFLLPWLWRRIRGRSSGDGRSPKYAEPLRWIP